MSITKIKLPLIAAIVAVVFTVGTTAFTTTSKPTTTATFAYQLSTFDQAEVQDVTNWAAAAPGCTAGTNKPCEIQVDETYTHLESGTRVLNNASMPDHVTITAKEGTSDPDDYIVDAQNSTNLAGVLNKP